MVTVRMRTDKAVLSVDFEFFEHTPAVRNASGNSPSGVGSDAVSFLHRALTNNDAEATLFFVSSIADSHPSLVEQFADGGFEIASHTHTHRLLTELSLEERRAEIEDSRSKLETVAGVSVGGFRAPVFDITPDHFDLLASAGYDYDSSVVPARAIPGWYGGDHAVTRPCRAFEIHPGAPDIPEVPVSVMPGIRLPLTGAWMRFFGRWWTLLGMWLLSRQGIAPVLYVHPWEFVELPDIDGVPPRVTVRTGRWMRQTIGAILNTSFEFVTLREIVDGMV